MGLNVSQQRMGLNQNLPVSWLSAVITELLYKEGNSSSLSSLVMKESGSCPRLLCGVQVSRHALSTPTGSRFSSSVGGGMPSAWILMHHKCEMALSFSMVVIKVLLGMPKSRAVSAWET